MDLEKLSSDGRVSLLTLPRADLKPPESSSSLSSDNNKSNSINNSPLMLLQLPLGWSVKDLNDSHFVANKRGDQAALVCNSKQTSFALQHVETSNCLVLVPPLIAATTSSMTATLTEQDETTSEESPTKKVKTTASSSSTSSSLDKLRSVPARLLKAGGSGASSLELHPKTLRLADLKLLLSKSDMLDPYNSSSNNNNNNGSNRFPTGRSIESLAHELQQSQAEIQQGLQRLEGSAFGMENIDNNENTYCYCLLSEEVQLVVNHAIISTLAEADEFDDYAGTGVPVDTFCQLTKERMSEEERFDGVEKVIRHLLLELANEKATSTKTIVKPVVSKVARWVARRLFSIQTTPWEENLFLARWQTDLPGVGDAYQVSTDMLRGLAIPLEESETGERFWMYLPADQIFALGNQEDVASVSEETLKERTARAFEYLFEKKDKWTMDQLQPYLDVIMDTTAISQADLLLQYTNAVTEEYRGVTVKLFRKR